MRINFPATIDSKSGIVRDVCTLISWNILVFAFVRLLPLFTDTLLGWLTTVLVVLELLDEDRGDFVLRVCLRGNVANFSMAEDLCSIVVGVLAEEQTAEAAFLGNGLTDDGHLPSSNLAVLRERLGVRDLWSDTAGSFSFAFEDAVAAVIPLGVIRIRVVESVLIWWVLPIGFNVVLWVDFVRLEAGAFLED